LEKFGKRKNAGIIRVIFLSSFEEITYLSYCIRDNPLKEKRIMRRNIVSFLLTDFLLCYCNLSTSKK